MTAQSQQSSQNTKCKHQKKQQNPFLSTSHKGTAKPIPNISFREQRSAFPTSPSGNSEAHSQHITHGNSEAHSPTHHTREQRSPFPTSPSGNSEAHSQHLLKGTAKRILTETNEFVNHSAGEYREQMQGTELRSISRYVSSSVTPQMTRDSSAD